MINYDELYGIISDFFTNQQVEKSEGDIITLINNLKEELNIVLHEYTDFDDLSKVSLDGFTVYDGKNFNIFYNNQRGLRIKFTLGHELGHIVLGHFFMEGVTMSTNIRSELEKEANIFSRCINFPAKIIDSHRIIFGDYLVKTYLLSKGFSKEFIDTSFNWIEEDLRRLVYPSNDYYSEVIKSEQEILFDLQKRYSEKVD